MTALGGSFWRLFGASATSNLADGVGRIAIPLLAASMTRDPVQISILVALVFLPWLVFAVPGGALVDRMDRRVAMAVANAFRALLFVALGVSVVAGADSIGLLYAVCLLFGFAEVIYDSAARAMLPAVVSRDQLDRGNGLMTIEEMVGQGFLGAPLGSVLFAAAAAVPFFGTGAGFAVAAVLILSVRGSFKPARAASSSLRADIVEGWRWLWRHEFLRGLTIMSGLVGVTQSMPNGIFVLFALQVLGLSDQGFGLLIVAAAVGGVAGGLSAARLARVLGRGGCLVLASVVAATMMATLGLVSSPWWAGLLFAVSSAAVAVWNVLSMSIRQAMIPPELFGRVLGSYRMVIWGAIPLGSVLGGLLAARTSLATVFVVAGVAQVLIAGGIWRRVRNHRDEIRTAFDEPAAELHPALGPETTATAPQGSP